MRRREWIEHRIEKRREWAEGRQAKADSLDRAGADYRHDWAFITQPGHIPARAAMNRRDEKAYEHRQMAKHHTSKAAGLESQLARTVFSDDDNAIQALQERIAKHEVERARYVAANKIVHRKPENQVTPEKVAELAALLGGETVARQLFEPDFCGRIGFPAYLMSNLGGRIKADKDRIAQIQARQERTEKAEAAGGVLIEGGEFGPIRITFPEKPERDIIDALKAAGFHYSGGYWFGQRDRIPAGLVPEDTTERMPAPACLEWGMTAESEAAHA